MKKTLQCFLIDDDLDDQEIFLMALEQVDHDITCVVANDAIEGLKKLNDDTKFTPDFIFIDINMPKINGIQCLPEIKNIGHLKDTKIVMTSTSSDLRIINASKELGADDFLVKPPGLDSLIESLTKILVR